MSIVIDTAWKLGSNDKDVFVFYYKANGFDKAYVRASQAYRRYCCDDDIDEDVTDWCLDILTGRIPLLPSDRKAKNRVTKQ